ncbi:hypothetical protein K435DRAFT_840654 [Dendrothele bispora CBS 962.96]|uniref:Uncharacterized protein n=1 Tax=Dendrothele bispora (strain CBS 962.96) TaxID=1314807 RepID=A0A4S8LRZ5_DENBC|nr:hypothetical protein K435DRAFT_840654 [Dendrothele bispora CBS 962.96]
MPFSRSASAPPTGQDLDSILQFNLLKRIKKGSRAATGTPFCAYAEINDAISSRPRAEVEKEGKRNILNFVLSNISGKKFLPAETDILRESLGRVLFEDEIIQVLSDKFILKSTDQRSFLVWAWWMHYQGSEVEQPSESSLEPQVVTATMLGLSSVTSNQDLSEAEALLLSTPTKTTAVPTQLVPRESTPRRRYQLRPRPALPKRDPSYRYGRVFGSPRSTFSGISSLRRSPRRTIQATSYHTTASTSSSSRRIDVREQQDKGMRAWQAEEVEAFRSKHNHILDD